MIHFNIIFHVKCFTLMCHPYIARSEKISIDFQRFWGSICLKFHWKSLLAKNNRFVRITVIGTSYASLHLDMRIFKAIQIIWTISKVIMNFEKQPKCMNTPHVRNESFSCSLAFYILYFLSYTVIDSRSELLSKKWNNIYRSYSRWTFQGNSIKDLELFLILSAEKCKTVGQKVW